MKRLDDEVLAVVSPHAAAGHCTEDDCPYCAVGHRKTRLILAAVRERYGLEPGAMDAALTAERYPTAA